MKQLTEVFQTWEAVIGLEVHAELTTLNTKMFCSCPVEYGAPPNTHTCPVCLGMPGALPVPNKAAIESIVLAGLATNCDIEKHTMFYRKNYFYPDMTKNFQTTQGPKAFCMRGSLELDVVGLNAEERIDLGMRAVVGDGATLSADAGADAGLGLGAEALRALPENVTLLDNGYRVSVGIERIHMEEDAGKLQHFGGVDGRISGADYSLLDYNRAGTPLIELVTLPDLRTPAEARLFMQGLRDIYLILGISDCSMEEGSLRCDGNVSLRRRGELEFGTKTELKNMNSFKNLHDGLAYEICRQAELLESGERIIQETRHFEPSKKKTISLRVKETAADYRLFPEPDLAPYDLSDEFIERVRAKLPELPAQKRERYMRDFSLVYDDANFVAATPGFAAFFDETLSGLDISLAKPVVNLMSNELASYLNANNLELGATKLKPEHLVEIVELLDDDTISSKQSKDLLVAALDLGKSPKITVKESGMEQVSDETQIEGIIDKILADNPDKVKEYRGGKTGLEGFFMGQAMRALKGQGNPKVVSVVIKRKLEE